MEPVETTSQLIWHFPYFHAALAVVLVLLGGSYFWTLHPLKLHRRLILLMLEALFYAGILVLCGNPAREIRSQYTIEHAPRAAFLYDVSGSMRIPGLIGPSRLDAALETAKKIELPPKCGVDIYAIGETFHKLSGPEKLPLAPAVPTLNTNLLETIPPLAAELAAEGIECAVLFTDGADNGANGSEQEALAALAANGIRLRIVPAVTEVALRRFLEFRKFESPGKTALNATVPVDAAVTFSNLAVSDAVELELVDENGNSLSRETGRHEGSGGTIFFHAELPMERLGLRHFRARLLLNGQPHREIPWRIDTVAPERKRVFLLQGTHDWAVRFLKRALSGSKIELTAARFKPELPEGGFPTPAELAEYDSIVLLNLHRNQTSPEMETRLRDFLRRGGGVLFISGNPLTAGEFRNSHLEELLPVRFSDQLNRAQRTDSKTGEFKRRILGYTRGTNARAENDFIRLRERGYQTTPLKQFEPTAAGREHPIFRTPAGDVLTPGFDDYALVAAAKPGAEVLAVWRDSGGAQHILFATERFGRGRSAVLATDPLWRWKLSLPSDRHDDEIFWTNLFNWLGDSGRQLGVNAHFSNLAPSVNEMLRITLTGSDDASTVATLVRENGKPESLALPAPDVDGVRRFSFTPREAGAYVLRIGDFERPFTVTSHGLDRELDAAAPNLPLLTRLGGAPGCRTLSPGEVPDLTTLLKNSVETASRSRVEPLWARWEILTALLALWGTILLLRRYWRLT